MKDRVEFDIKKEEEEWVKIEGTNDYFISNMGRVKSYVRNRVVYLTPYLVKSKVPFLRVRLRRTQSGMSRNIVVHVEVAKMFLYNPYNAVYVIPKDGNACNCKATNLDWKIGNIDLSRVQLSNQDLEKLNSMLRYFLQHKYKNIQRSDISDIIQDTLINGLRQLQRNSQKINNINSWFRKIADRCFLKFFNSQNCFRTNMMEELKYMKTTKHCLISL